MQFESLIKRFQRSKLLTGMKIIPCDITAKDVVAFCLFPRSLPEAKLKSHGLISLGEEISIQFNIDSLTWLLVIILMQIYNEK